MNVAVLAPRIQSTSQVMRQIRIGLSESGKTLRTAIAERELYFRVSLVGTCNLSCPFCHNEGAPIRGRLDLAFAINAINAAAKVGFTRVQFTGGEPLLHPQVALFVRDAKQIVSDVGITTNGTFLVKHIGSLIEAGVTRIHISLQVESLVQAGKNNQWGVPDWLAPMLNYAAQDVFILRLNMPIPGDMLKEAKSFLEELAQFGCDLKVFSILPEGSVQNIQYPIDRLMDLVDAENIRRKQKGQKGKVFLRGYAPPIGIRCQSCLDYSKCKEQSHSLRLGSDRILRPCLATRSWDTLLTEESMIQQIEEAAVLAIDY